LKRATVSSEKGVDELERNIIELFPSPAAGFDHPLEILDACHQRVRRHCALLRRLAQHVLTRGADAEARQAAQSILRYFNEAAHNHHLDEEQDLFPALEEATSGQERLEVATLLKQLRSEHHALEAMWRRMRTKLEDVQSGRSESLTEASACNLGEAYQQHISLEEAQLLPIARRLLGQEDLARLGASMAARRGARNL
jgi:hemerythrin-like domain-containing protein